MLTLQRHDSTDVYCLVDELVEKNLPLPNPVGRLLISPGYTEPVAKSD